MDRSRIQRQYMEPMIPFKLKAPFQPTGDQPKAVKSLVQGLNEGQWAQVLLGATVRVKHLPWPRSLKRYSDRP